MYNRDFKGVWIPREVWLDYRLNPLEKIILAEIDSLDNSDDRCWAGNDYLAEFCQCSEWKVSNAISKLIELGYVEVVSFDGRIRRLKSCFVFSKREPCENPKADLGISQPINIRNNTKIKHTVSEGSQGDDSPFFAEFWKAYPRKTSKQMAIKSWKKLGVDDSNSLLDTILADVRRRVNGEWAGKELQYVPHPSTYLNQRRWEDETATTDRVDAEEEHDLPLEEILRRGDDCSVPEGFTPCGGW